MWKIHKKKKSLGINKRWARSAGLGAVLGTNQLDVLWLKPLILSMLHISILYVQLEQNVFLTHFRLPGLLQISLFAVKRVEAHWCCLSLWILKSRFQKTGISNPHAKTSTPSNDNICKMKKDSILIPAQKNIWYFVLPSCLWKKQYLTNIGLILGEDIFQMYYLMNFKGCLINYVIIFLDCIPD